ERLLEFSSGKRRSSRPHQNRSVVISDGCEIRSSFDGRREMSFGLFQIAGVVRHEAEVGVGRDFIHFESECFLKPGACGSSVTAVERSHSIVNDLLCLLGSRRNVANEEAQKAQNDFSATANHLCFLWPYLQLEDKPPAYLNSARLEDVGIAC